MAKIELKPTESGMLFGSRVSKGPQEELKLVAEVQQEFFDTHPEEIGGYIVCWIGKPTEENEGMVAVHVSAGGTEEMKQQMLMSLLETFSHQISEDE